MLIIEKSSNHSPGDHNFPDICLHSTAVIYDRCSRDQCPAGLQCPAGDLQEGGTASCRQSHQGLTTGNDADKRQCVLMLFKQLPVP